MRGTLDVGVPKVLTPRVIVEEATKDDGELSHVIDVHGSAAAHFFVAGSLSRADRSSRVEAAGQTVFLSPEPIVDQIRDDLRLGALCRERIAWGRLYARLRLSGARWFERVALVAVSPALPLLLMFRIGRDRIVKRRDVMLFLAAAPSVLLLVCAWSVGEAAEYLLSLAGRARRA